MNRNSNHGDGGMSWTPIATMGVLTLTTIGLVHFLGWDPFVAGIIVGSSSLLLGLGCGAIVSLFLNREERREFWGIASSTMKKDLADIVDMLPFRRR